MARLSDLFIDKKTGKLSQQRTWMNIAMVVITSTFVWYAYSLRLEEWMFWAYSIIAVFPNLISKWIRARFGINIGDKREGLSDESSK